jgi:hypothetical protein
MSKESFLRNALTISAALFLEAWFYFLVGSKRDPDSELNLNYAWPKSSVVNPDWIPDSMGSLDPYPDPDSQSGSGSRRGKMAQKNIKQFINFIF